MRTFVRIAVMSFAMAGLVRPAVALDATSLRRARHLVDKGQSALKKGRIAHAEKLFRQAIALEPVLPTSYTGLAAVFVARKHFGQALSTAREAEQRFLEFQKKLEEAQLQDRGLTSHALSSSRGPAMTGAQTPDIEKQLTTRRWTKVKKNPVPAEVYYIEGLCEVRTGQRARGIDDLEKCLRKDPEHGLAHYNLAVALFVQGDYHEAKRHLDRAVSLGIKANPMFVRDLDARLGTP